MDARNQLREEGLIRDDTPRGPGRSATRGGRGWRSLTRSAEPRLQRLPALDEVRPRETDDEDGGRQQHRVQRAMVEQKGRQEAKHRNKHNVTQEAVLVGEGPRFDRPWMVSLFVAEVR